MVFSPLFQGTKYITRPVPPPVPVPPPPCHMYFSSYKLPAQVGKLQVASKLPTQIGKLQVASKLPAQVGKLQVASMLQGKVGRPVGKLQVVSKLQVSRQVAGKCKLQLPAQFGKLQVARQVAVKCRLKLASCKVKLAGKLSAIGGIGDHELSS